MAAHPLALDPYRSPSLPEGPYAGAPPSGRPGKLTVLCVLCIVLGALGLMNSLMGAAGAVIGPKLQMMFQPKPSANMPPEMQQAQQKFQDDVINVQKNHFGAVVGALVFRFVAALLLLVGGILTLGLHDSGRKVLLVACVAAIVFELLHAILQSIINMEMMTAVNSYVEGMLQSMPEKNETPPGFGNLMQSIVKGSIIGGLVVSYILVLAKVALYLFGLIYLQKSHIRALFKPA